MSIETLSTLNQELSAFPQSRVRLRLGKANDFRAFFELPAFLEQFDAFETLQDIPFRGDRAGSL